MCGANYSTPDRKLLGDYLNYDFEGRVSKNKFALKAYQYTKGYHIQYGIEKSYENYTVFPSLLLVDYPISHPEWVKLKPEA